MKRLRTILAPYGYTILELTAYLTLILYAVSHLYPEVKLIVSTLATM